MKNLFKVTLLMVAMFSMIACGSNAGKNVNKVAQMVEAMESGDFEKAAAIEQEIQEWYDNASIEEIEEFEQSVSGLAESVMAEFGDAYEDVFEKVSNNYNDVMKITEEMVGDSYEDAIETAEKAYNDALSTIQDQMAQIEQIVGEIGLDFDQKAFLEYCRDNNVAPANMKGEFLNSHYTQMLEKAKQSASLATSTQNKQNKAKALNSSTKQTGAQAPKPLKTEQDLRDALLAIE